jgi:hypothetical protein
MLRARCEDRSNNDVTMSVIPAEAGVQQLSKSLDSRVRWNDEQESPLTDKLC